MVGSWRVERSNYSGRMESQEALFSLKIVKAGVVDGNPCLLFWCGSQFVMNITYMASEHDWELGCYLMKEKWQSL